MRSKQARARYPLCFHERLGPHRTIAKENGERKGKSQKRPEKCAFFRGHVEIPAENAVRTRAKASLVGSNGHLKLDKSGSTRERSDKRQENWKELEQKLP